MFKISVVKTSYSQFTVTTPDPENEENDSDVLLDRSKYRAHFYWSNSAGRSFLAYLLPDGVGLMKNEFEDRKKPHA